MPTHQEQPGADRRARCGEDRHCRGPCTADHQGGLRGTWGRASKPVESTPPKCVGRVSTEPQPLCVRCAAVRVVYRLTTLAAALGTDQTLQMLPQSAMPIIAVSELETRHCSCVNLTPCVSCAVSCFTCTVFCHVPCFVMSNHALLQQSHLRPYRSLCLHLASASNEGKNSGALTLAAADLG